MRRTSWPRQSALLLLLLAAGTLSAQVANFSYSFRPEGSGAAVNVNSNGVIQFTPGAVGTRQNGTLLIQNRGDVSWSMTRVLTAGSGFTTDATPTAIAAGQTVPVNLSFTPTGQGNFEGTLNISFTSGQAAATAFFFLRASGLGADVILSYIVNPNGNQTSVGAGGLLTFPPTQVGQTITATFIVFNRGGLPATLDQVSVAGEPYRVSGLPLLPVNIATDRDVRFTINFAPVVRDVPPGSLTVRIGGENRVIQLAGTTVATQYSYETIVDSRLVPVDAEGTIRIPDIAIGSVSSIRFRLRNLGNLAGRINVIQVSGTGFQLADTPALPLTLAPSATAEFILRYEPRDPSPATGRLRLDDVGFNLTGTGLGPRFGFATVIGSSTTPVLSTGTILFPNAPVGSTVAGEFRIENTGNAPGSIASVSTTGSAFRIRNLPALPVNLAAGAVLSLPLEFSPDGIGTLNGALLVDDARFTLRGIGANPPPLPRLTLASPSATIEPLQQPVVTLTIAAPYTLDLTGRLTLGFNSESFTDDPAIQFATGGRTVDFRIPAGSTQAQFGSAPQIIFQSGTVSGQITLAATVATSGVDITPQPAPTVNFAIAAGPPQLRGLQVNARGGGYDLVVSGYSTSRAVTQLNLQLTPSAGANLQTTTLTSNVDSAFATWYQNTTSRAFGSQFSLTIPLNVTGDVNAIQSVSVSLSNARGSSNTVSAAVR